MTETSFLDAAEMDLDEQMKDSSHIDVVLAEWDLSPRSDTNSCPFDVVGGVTDGSETFDIVIIDSDAELVLDGNDDLHHRQGVDTEVIDEG